ncbi:hypothetical protein GF326_12725 [Candidatus Bathyarchaeota archaeon]|nr:hypothetical protein [Candidatus Bathyarchaeota archaeon]
MVSLETETLWNECDLAVVGTVLSVNNTEKGGFYRIVEVEVETYYLRELDEPTVKIRIEGGEFGDMGIWVEDQPEFSVGEHVFVFLSIPEEITGDYGFTVFGLFQGKWSVDGSTVVRGSQSFELPSNEELARIAAERADSNTDVAVDDYRNDWGQTPKEIGIAILMIIIVLLVLFKRVRN